MPPTPPANPPKPTAVPTARRGNMSEASVNMLADQAWWQAVASPMSSTAVQSLFVWLATITVGTTAATMPMVVLRARFTDQPALMNADDRYPPAIYPTSEMMYTVVRYGMMAVPRMPCSVARNFGSQKR